MSNKEQEIRISLDRIRNWAFSSQAVISVVAKESDRRTKRVEWSLLTFCQVAYKTMLKAYTKEDRPPNRVKHIFVIAHAGSDPQQHCVADMICLAFFFLLRPGEYLTVLFHLIFYKRHPPLYLSHPCVDLHQPTNLKLTLLPPDMPNITRCVIHHLS